MARSPSRTSPVRSKSPKRKSPAKKSSPKKKSSPARAKSPARRSPVRKSPSAESRRDRMMRMLRENSTIWIYLVVIALVALWSTLYAIHGNGWWDGVQTFAPSWGDSQALILVLLSAFYLSMSYISFKLSMAVRDRNSQLMLYSAFALLSLLAAAFMYVMADGRERYAEAFYIMILAAVISLIILYFAAVTRDAVSLWVGAGALAIVAYLVAWSWEVKDNSGQ